MHSIPIIRDDDQLRPYEFHIRNRMEWFYNTLDYIQRDFGDLDEFANAHNYFGFNYDTEKKGWWFREWLPNAFGVFLTGDFNRWDRFSHPLKQAAYGVWEIFLSDEKYANKLLPFSKIKMVVHGKNGMHDRLPAYIRRVTQNTDNTFDGQFIGHSDYAWTDSDFQIDPNQALFIYEAHVGMAQEEAKVGTYTEFKEVVLPRIKKLGYNAVQLMAVQEHPYYGSFGYQVANFFAPSSRFGTPDELRDLINQAHEMGIAVILDVVHSHAVKNLNEGLAELDGTEQYFSGWHPDWDSRLFDYSKIEVKRFLLSNLRYWMDEFHFDGFRFDGVTSMLYNHFGHVDFGHMDRYFYDTNSDAILYLQLANELIHNRNPNVLSICEDMSGMPGACRKVEEGGLGFDFRLNMGLPDYWTTTLETKRDEDWHMGDLFHRLTNRRDREKNIGYAESHDQALVGDKTIAFWLMDKEMYTGMSVFEESLVIDRGIALHKLIRFSTLCLGGEGYMNFMGNEFGHPEWVDFPREGNNWSCTYARRQWSLPDTDHLKYKFLEAFDQAMLAFAKENHILETLEKYKRWEDNDQKVLAFEVNSCLFVFNFGVDSLVDYAIDMPYAAELSVVFSSDDKIFGGFERIDKQLTYATQGERNTLKLYLPNRTVLVFR